MGQFKERFGEPERVLIYRSDGRPSTPNLPTKAVVPLYHGKKAQDFALADANSLIFSDFDEGIYSRRGAAPGEGLPHLLRRRGFRSGQVR
ncbi:hypothetical protein O1611_g7567 [Lasiodiplodia mahajangana]|uniref:Uncharacterized protein n=1 Tax=Lasiodiplodia mahajangana TaxID=1108764 RepID=A0ACC2JF44_9PEZI|nr:hypothetical protein O1611_g7567 [Lasiodiplodia mahajangana]